MDKKKKGGPKIWSRQQERILQKWGEAAACYRYMHNQAFLTFKKSSMRFTIPALILVWWFPLPKGLYLDLFKVSLIGSTLQYGLTYTGLNIIDASSAILLVQLEVPFGIIIAFFLLKDSWAFI